MISNTISNNVSLRPSYINPKNLCWIIMTIGALLRLFHYFTNRSLWLDELFIALNLQYRSIGGLIGRLNYSQAAPYGFLVIEKLAAELFEYSELALRLFPLLCGLVSLPIFYALALRLIRSQAVPVALGLFAISWTLIYYSSEVKQYSSDVMLTLLLMLLAVEWVATKKRSLALSLAVIGALSIWLSMPSIFILATIGWVLMVVAWRSGYRTHIVEILLVGGVWACSFGVFYVVSLLPMIDKTTMDSYWQAYFAPIPPRSRGDLLWYERTFFNVFNYAIGAGSPKLGSFAALGAFVAIVGAVGMWPDRKLNLVFLLPPFLLTLAASALRLYPFSDRLLLFLLPTLYLLIGEGAAIISTQTRTNNRLIGAVLITLLLIYPLAGTGFRVLNPYVTEHIKPIFQRIAAQRQAGDSIYVYYQARYALRFYADRYDIDTMHTIMGETSTHDATWAGREGARLQGQDRVWVVLSHFSPADEQLLISQLDVMGTRLDRLGNPGSVVYLYDLKRP